jgi:hypothetical protein
MPPAHLPGVFLQHPHLPLAVLEKLPCQSAVTFPVLIERTHCNGQIHFASGLANAVVQLVVLVAHELFIEEADALERAARPHTHVNSVHFPVCLSKVKIGTDAEGRVHGTRNRLCRGRAPGGSHRPTDVVRTRSTQRSHPFPQVIRLQDRVRIHSGDDVPTGGPDPNV